MPFDGRTMPGVDLFEACGSRPSESAAAVADAWSLSHGHSVDRHALGLEGVELIAAHLAFHGLSSHEAEIHDAGQLHNAARGFELQHLANGMAIHEDQASDAIADGSLPSGPSRAPEPWPASG